MESVDILFKTDDQRDRVAEIAEIFELLKSLCESHAIFIDDVISVAKNKRELQGDFSEKIFLEGTEDGGHKQVEGAGQKVEQTGEDTKENDDALGAGQAG